MAWPIHWQLLFWRLICFVTTSISLAIYSWNVSSGRIRIRVFGYMYLTLMVQISMCSLELVGQFISMCFGSTAPVPKHLVLCLLLILVNWLLALLTVGTACASLGILTFFIANNFFDRSVNIRAMIHCVLSLVAGASAAVSALLVSEIAKARRRQAQE